MKELEDNYITKYDSIDNGWNIRFNREKNYNVIHDSNLPEISRFDPVALLLGMKPGQICKITRNSKTAIHAPYYRVCVNY